MTDCPICGEKLIEELPGDGDNSFYNCVRCGKYILSNSVAYGSKLPHTASSWIWEQNKVDGRPPKITTDIYEKLKNIPDKTISSKLEAFMQEIGHRASLEIGQGITIQPQSEKQWLSVTWAKDCDELQAIAQEAIDSDLIAGKVQAFMGGDVCSWNTYITNITFKGRHFIESMGQSGGNSNKVFMAFHFTDEMKESFEMTTKRAVTDASNGKLEAVRVGTSSTPTDTKIDDALIAMLKASKVVIADFTGQRQAVYYEAGYAMGMGIPVIWTCRADEVDKLSFDTRQYPHILWEDEEDLYKQLTERLSAQIL